MKALTQTLLAASIISLMTGCVTTQMPAESQNYNPENSARIRLFGQNGLPSTMTVQVRQGANEQTIKINVGGGMGDAFGSMMGVAKNDGIGIPETENTKNLAGRNGILSKAFYREFVIPANKPVTVANAYIGLPAITSMPAQGGSLVYQEGSCSSNTVSFTPRAGKDYEVDSYKTRNGCAVIVFEVQTNAGKTVLAPVEKSLN